MLEIETIGPDVTIFKDPSNGSSITFDVRYFPIVLSAFNGAPTMELSEKYFEFRKPLFDLAVRENLKVVMLADLTHGRPPPATVRKYTGERGRVDDMHPAFLGYVSCVPNRLARGVVTALQWIAGDDVREIRFASSVDDAMAKATAFLQEANIDVSPVNYEPPDPQS